MKSERDQLTGAQKLDLLRAGKLELDTQVDLVKAQSHAERGSDPYHDEEGLVFMDGASPEHVKEVRRGLGGGRH